MSRANVLNLVKSYAKKPHHTETVRLVQLPVKCVCGTYYYVPETFLSEPSAACPDCHERPRPFRVGAPEEFEVDIHLRFGNPVGEGTPRRIGPALSRGIVTNPTEIVPGHDIIRPVGK